jgi:hypothetical protein
VVAACREALTRLLDERRGRALEVAAERQAEAESRLRDYQTPDGRTLEQLAPVLADRHRAEAVPRARPDPRHQGRIAPSIRRGWVATSAAGRPGVRLRVLIQRAELDWLVSELSALQQAVQGDVRELEDLVRIGTAVAAGETAFLAEDRGQMAFAEHLRRREGLPVLRPDSLLQRSQRDLLQVDETTRAALDEALSTALARLLELRQADPWSDPARSFHGFVTVPFDWIDF